MSYVVTGGGRGIGRAIVERLLADGHPVVVIERDAVELPAGAVAVIGDAGADEVTERAAARAAELAPLRGWVNNAAVFRDASLHEVGTRELLDLVTVNLGAVVSGARAAVRAFLAAGTGGSIVNLSSHQARLPVPGCAPYATAKAAIEGLTRALAVDYGPHGIRVNVVAPGSVDTARYREFADARVEAEMARLHPLGRVAAAAEIADAVAYLLSDRASFISGVTLPVDGGRSVRGHDPEPPRTAG
ncbi:SDR family NAD(P)-dependent oxidoreductase [Catenuloplanes atrovinosus]|uniref:NAD(P)-dependent dehydrogenase (Short-subunit alcohol dehydrogenase family) n=1 Tax=Catenuloplanes atrovinosus TaxID=137266 RepID=A0AAE3YM40_9ACTN|nr:SDR family oxidoreductase [Catenuloplanes atrovinosus]MDR7274704.1 NAD(P)-dependent dehydrogenase (short-subunit alcohol dehydrogenase family) [Catenuloplanes atrovinosus]